MPNIIFVDQTLDYVLKNQRVKLSEMIRLKQKISEMADFVFDISADTLQSLQGRIVVGLSNTRVAIKPNSNHVKSVYQLGCNHVKILCCDDIAEGISERLLAALMKAKQYRMNISLGIKGMSAQNLHKPDVLSSLVREYGISSLVIDDGGNSTDPLRTRFTVEALLERIPCTLEYHGHNGVGLATGNALAALKSGIEYIAVSIGGISGYPAFEEVLMGAKYLVGLPVLVPSNLAERCQEVLSMAGQVVLPTKAIIGSHIFAHESGIHVDGVNKKSELYEPFSPETVGLSRKIIIGKHSGKASIECKLRELNISYNPSQVPAILENVRRIAVRQKAAVTDVQLQKMVGETNYDVLPQTCPSSFVHINQAFCKDR